MPLAVQILLGILAGIGLVAVLLVAYVAGEAFYYQIILGLELMRDLGFREGAQYLPAGGILGHESAVAIVEVVDGGVFDRAGIRAGDVLPDDSHSSLFRTLHRARGRTAELTVVDGGPGPSFHLRQRRLIRVDVPPRRRPT